MIPKRPRRVDLEFVCVFGHECVQRRLACSVGESPTRVKVSTCALPWCTTPIEAESSLGPDSHHPIISLSGIPSAVIVLRILHPILASTLCAANPLARIAEPTIAL